MLLDTSTRTGGMELLRGGEWGRQSLQSWHSGAPAKSLDEFRAVTTRAPKKSLHLLSLDRESGQ